VTHPAVAEAVGEDYVSVEEALGQEDTRPQLTRERASEVSSGN
jgi:hypothetical protein